MAATPTSWPWRPRWPLDSPDVNPYSPPLTINIFGDRIINCADPKEPLDVANKQFVEATIALAIASTVPAPVVFTITVPDYVKIGQLLKAVGNAAMDAITCLTNTTCSVGMLVAPNRLQTGGVVSGIFNNLIPGRSYYVGPDGFPSIYPLTIPPNTRFFLQKIGIALAYDALLLSPSLEVKALLSH